MSGLKSCATTGRGPPTPSSIKAIAEVLQQVAYDNVPYVNYGQWFLPTVYSKSLQGVQRFPGAVFSGTSSRLNRGDPTVTAL